MDSCPLPRVTRLCHATLFVRLTDYSVHQRYYVDPRRWDFGDGDVVVKADSLFAKTAADLFIGAYDAQRQRFYAAFDDDWGKSNISFFVYVAPGHTTNQNKLRRGAAKGSGPRALLGLRLRKVGALGEQGPWSGPRAVSTNRLIVYRIPG